MENETLDNGDQPSPLTQPLQQLPDDLLRDIFHRLPTDPSALAFVSMAYKDWRRLVRDEENFLRPFRAAHQSVPPLLGLIPNAYYGDIQFKFTPTTTNAVELMPPTLAHDGWFRASGCTHGRVLLYRAWEWDNNHHGELIVWDPLTGEQNLIPPAPGPGFHHGQRCGAALVCDADHAHGGDCHSSPFRVVFAYSQYDSWREGLEGPPAIHVFARVYSSKTGSWDGRLAATMGEECHLGWNPSAVAGNGAAVYWMTEVDRTVAEFQLQTQRLLLIDTPEVIRGHNFFLAPAMDARLRLAGVMDNSVMLFSLDEGAWVSRTLVRFEDFLPFHAYADYENGGDGLLYVVEYSDDEDEEDLLDDDTQLDCIFLQAEPGVFMINLESGQHQRVLEPDQRFYGSVYPYSAFYTPVNSNMQSRRCLRRKMKIQWICNIPR
ncbi:hypothetical protein VPH35_094494 [Triticum aestivum]